MDAHLYLMSLGDELSSLKSRVRHLIDDAHWQTDGEWKESVLRTVLRRNLPASVSVGRGFVVADNHTSHQIDILLYDSSSPVLFRDGELVFVTPDAVVGLIEVKSRVNHSTFREAALKLAEDVEWIRQIAPTERRFAGMFAYEGDSTTPNGLLDGLVAASPTWNSRIDFASVGDAQFAKYWSEHPINRQRRHEAWHGYTLDGLAQGYFVHNVVEVLFPVSVSMNSKVWFPDQGKESQQVAVRIANWASASV